MKNILFLLFLFFSSLSAEDFFDDEPLPQETAPPSLVNLTSLPSSIVNHSVNMEQRKGQGHEGAGVVIEPIMPNAGTVPFTE